MPTQQFSLAMSYDGIHNITHKTQTSFNVWSTGAKTPNLPLTYDWTYAYAGGRPHAASQIGNHAFKYDLDGNQAGWNATDSGQNRVMVWDEDNRLQSVTDSSGQPTTFKYDDGTNRVVKKGAGGETLYINPWYVAALGRNSKQIFAGATRIATKLEQFPSGEGYGAGAKNLTSFYQYFYHPDHLGSTSFVTDATGEVYQHLEYFPFGETWVDEVSDDTRVPWRFTGQEFDPETRLYYFGARYYDPRTSAWENSDPALAAYVSGQHNTGVYQPRNLASYGYTWNNPVKLTDPDGRCPNCVTAAIGAGVGAAIGGGVEAARQYWTQGTVSDWSKVATSAGRGAITGAAAGFTGGASLAVQAGVGATVNVATGVAERAINGEEQSLTASVIDAGVGIATPLAAKGVSAVAEKYGPRITGWFRRTCSFDGSTPVLTKEGLKRIDQISVNELVFAKDEKTGETGWKPVLDRYNNEYKERVIITLEAADGTKERIVSNRIHPFYAKDKGWLQADELRVGDSVGTHQESVWALVAATRIEATPLTAYNLSVEGYHNYFIGNVGAWVHNCDITWKGFSKGSLAEHFEKHGSEFGEISQSQYLRAAKEFAGEFGEFLEEKVGNFYVKYDPATRRTLVGHVKDREIRTYYKADQRSADPFEAAKQHARELGGNE